MSYFQINDNTSVQLEGIERIDIVRRRKWPNPFKFVYEVRIRYENGFYTYVKYNSRIRALRTMSNIGYAVDGRTIAIYGLSSKQ